MIDRDYRHKYIFSHHFSATPRFDISYVIQLRETERVLAVLVTLYDCHPSSKSCHI